MEQNQHHKQHQLDFIVEGHEQGLLREFLLEHKGISRRSLSKVKNEGQLLVNGQEVTVRYSLTAGDQVRVIFPPEQESQYLQPEAIPLEIIFEDEYILVLNKPAQICVHPTFNYTSGTLANGVMHYWQSQGVKRTFHAVNRLDQNTSGLVVIAQNSFSHHQLSKQQKGKTFIRRYYAFVHGQLEQQEGTITAPIARKSDSIVERTVREDGQTAITHFQVLQYNPTLDISWVQLQLETGRTHQIRVHMQHIGHPLVGDDLYGGRRDLLSRQALHAYYTAFRHPFTDKHCQFEVALPEDMLSLIHS